MRLDPIRLLLTGAVAAVALVVAAPTLGAVGPEPVVAVQDSPEEPTEAPEEPTEAPEEPTESPEETSEPDETTSVEGEEPALEPGGVSPAVWVGVIALVVVAAVWVVWKSGDSSSSPESAG